jgi:hypothetical protein
MVSPHGLQWRVGDSDCELGRTSIGRGRARGARSRKTGSCGSVCTRIHFSSLCNLCIADSDLVSSQSGTRVAGCDCRCKTLIITVIIRLTDRWDLVELEAKATCCWGAGLGSTGTQHTPIWVWGSAGVGVAGGCQQERLRGSWGSASASPSGCKPRRHLSVCAALTDPFGHQTDEETRSSRAAPKRCG